MSNQIRSCVSDLEWEIRCDLAALYRIIAVLGWDDLVFTHISARLPGDQLEFLINPYGLMFHEITASNLVKVDVNCSPLHPTHYKVNPAGFTIHSSIHLARPDITCVLHTHTTSGVAVSANNEGLLPISQQASVALTSLSYHDYEGIALRDEEKPRLQKDLGQSNFLILRNHGLLTVGKSIPEAFMYMYFLETACQIQVKAGHNRSQLTHISGSVLSTTRKFVDKQLEALDTRGIFEAMKRKAIKINPGYDG